MTSLSDVCRISSDTCIWHENHIEVNTNMTCKFEVKQETNQRVKTIRKIFDQGVRFDWFDTSFLMTTTTQELQLQSTHYDSVRPDAVGPPTLTVSMITDGDDETNIEWDILSSSGWCFTGISGLLKLWAVCITPDSWIEPKTTTTYLISSNLVLRTSNRSEERRVGKECRSRGSPYQ